MRVTGGQHNDFNDFLERIFPLPNALHTIEEARRGRHEDLNALTDDDLAREWRLAQLRADLDDDRESRAWCVERVAAVTRERERRRAAEETTAGNDSSRSRPVRNREERSNPLSRRGVQVIGGKVVDG